MALHFEFVTIQRACCNGAVDQFIEVAGVEHAGLLAGTQRAERGRPIGRQLQHDPLRQAPRCLAVQKDASTVQQSPSSLDPARGHVQLAGPDVIAHGYLRASPGIDPPAVLADLLHRPCRTILVDGAQTLDLGGKVADEV